MTPEDRIYGLIAQAEDIQAHAVSLQRRAVETFDALPKSVKEAGDELRSHWMKATGLSIATVICAGIAVGIGVSAYIHYKTASLGTEAEALRKEVNRLKTTAAQLASQTWNLELIDYGPDERIIVIPQGYKIKSKGRLKDDGRAAIEITRE